MGNFQSNVILVDSCNDLNHENAAICLSCAELDWSPCSTSKKAPV